MTSHAAPGQAAGYLYQCRYALLVALQQLGNKPQLLLSIEHLDDVAFEDGADPIARLQTKHQLNRAATLTDTCTDLWKTLGIWSTEVANEPSRLDSEQLLLITTALAPPESAASLLRAVDRDEKRACELLLNASKKSTSQSNAKHYEAFGDLAPETQIGLLSAVQVLDRSPSLVELEGALKHELRLLAPAASRTEALQRIEGWWWNRVAQALVEPARKHIAILELESFLDAVREALKAESLPVDFADAVPSDTTANTYDKRMFVRQLRLVNCAPRRISRAKRDFYRAFEQRSKWTREYLVLPHELQDYERRLLEQWEPRFDQMVERLADSKESAQPAKAGQDILYWVETDAQEPLRNVTERYLTVGSYHMLSDDCRIGWHPQYRGLAAVQSASDNDDGEAK